MYKLSKIQELIRDSQSVSDEYYIQLDASANALYILHSLGALYQDVLVDYLFDECKRIRCGKYIEKPEEYFDQKIGKAQFKYTMGNYKEDPYTVDYSSLSYTSMCNLLGYGYRAMRKNMNKLVNIDLSNKAKVRNYFYTYGLHMKTYLDPFKFIIPIKNRSFLERDIIQKKRIRIPKFGIWKLKKSDVALIPFEATLSYCKLHINVSNQERHAYIMVRVNQQPRDEDGYINMKKRKD